MASRTASGATFRRIVESARATLAEEGPSGFSMRGVAKRAGVTPGAIYRHVRDREELIDRVVDESLASFELELTRAMATEPVGSYARVVALGRKYMEFVRTHPEEFKVLFSPRAEPRKLGVLPGRGGFDLLRQCIAEAMESGELRAADPDVMAFYLWSRVHGLVMLLLACDFSEEMVGREQALTPEAAFVLTRDLALYGIAPDAKAAAD